MASTLTKRLFKELKRAEELSDCGIYVHAEEDNIKIIHAVIKGPNGTPYEGGFFHFLIEHPNDYPFSSPKAKILTTGSGTVRFNPNLYSCGKVCLSILGTWSGPAWSPSYTISTVLLSIQSLLGENPLRNEPGYEVENYNDFNEIYAYNNQVRYDTIRIAAIANIEQIIANKSSIPSPLHHYILSEYPKHIDYYRRICKENLYKELYASIEKLSPSGVELPANTNSNNDSIRIARLKKLHVDTYINNVEIMLDEKEINIENNTLINENILINSINLDRDLIINDDEKIIENDKSNKDINNNNNNNNNNNIDSHLDELEDSEDQSIEIREDLKCACCFDLLATAVSFDCGHVSCSCCAYQWLSKADSCPVCRNKSKLTSLRRIFALDSLTEKEAKNVFSNNNELYEEWKQRRDKGIELDNEKKPIRVGYNKYQDDEDYYSGGDSDDGDGMNYSYPNTHHGGFGYFSAVGSGYKLGTSIELAPEVDSNHKFIFGQEDFDTSLTFDNTNLNTSITINDDIDIEDVVKAEILAATKESIREARMKRMNASSPVADKNIDINKEKGSNILNITSARKVSLSTQASEYDRLKRQKEEDKLQRMRIQAEIALDKQSRLENKGKIPGTHYSQFSSTNIKYTLPVPSSTKTINVDKDIDIDNNSMKSITISTSPLPIKSSTSPVATSSIPTEEKIDNALTIIFDSIADNKGNTSKLEVIRNGLNILISMFSKIILNPEELKYRKINTQSKIYKEKIVILLGVPSLLKVLGFVKEIIKQDDGNSITYLVFDFANDIDMLQYTCTKLLNSM